MGDVTDWWRYGSESSCQLCVCVWTQGEKDALIVPAVVSPFVVSCSALRLNVLMLFQLMD